MRRLLGVLFALLAFTLQVSAAPPLRAWWPAPTGGGPTPAATFDWSGCSLAAGFTYGGGTNGRKWSSAALLVAGSSGRTTYSASSVGTCLGLMLEGARTNVVFPSQDISSANFYIDNGTATVNGVTSPDGTSNADTLVGSNVTGGEVCVGVNNLLTTGNVAMSTFYKVASVRPTNFAGLMHLGGVGTNGFASSVKNISTGAAGSTGVDSGGRGTVRASGTWNAGNSGWWRIWQTGSTTDTPYQTFQYAISDAATPSGGYDAFGQQTITGQYNLVLWQMQLEAADFPSSPIVTTTAAVTRTADTATSTDTSLIAGGAWVLSARTALGSALSGEQTLAQADGGAATNRWRWIRNTSNEIHFIVTTASATVADLNCGTVANDTAFKVASRAFTNDYACSVTGGTVAADTAGTLPTVTTFRGGTDSAGANYWFGILTKLDAYTTLTNAQLQSLSL